jgi:tetratricopeptide (TPR) repeat protein
VVQPAFATATQAIEHSAMSNAEPTSPGAPHNPTFGAEAANTEPVALKQARALRKANKPNDALQVAKAFLERAPNAHWRYEALDAIADAYAAKFEDRAALDIGHELTALNPGRPEGFAHVASAGMVLGKMRDAIEALETGLSRHPHSHLLMVLNSLRFARVHDTARAMEWAERAMALAPEDPDCLTALATALTVAGRSDEAKWARERARETYLKANDTPTTAAQFAFGDARFREAFRLSRTALADNPQDPKAKQVFVRARIYKNLLLAPYFATFQLSKTRAVIAATAMLGVLGALYVYDPRTCAIVAAAVVLYYLVCVCICLLVEGLYDPRRGKRL